MVLEDPDCDSQILCCLKVRGELDQYVVQVTLDANGNRPEVSRQCHQNLGECPRHQRQAKWQGLVLIVSVHVAEP